MTHTDPREKHDPWAMACHLSALFGYAVPFGNIIGPLFVWLLKGKEDPKVMEHGREALNFQITVMACIAVLICIFFLIPAALGIWTQAPILISSAAVGFAIFFLLLAGTNIFLIFKNALRGFKGESPQYYYYFHVLK